MPKGAKYGGRVAGTPNKVTTQFKEALNLLLEECSPRMIDWLERVAKEDPAKALDMVSKLAEYVHPKLARSEIDATHNGNLRIEVVKFADSTNPG